MAIGDVFVDEEELSDGVGAAEGEGAAAAEPEVPEGAPQVAREVREVLYSMAAWDARVASTKTPDAAQLQAVQTEYLTQVGRAMEEALVVQPCGVHALVRQARGAKQFDTGLVLTVFADRRQWSMEGNSLLERLLSSSWYLWGEPQEAMTVLRHAGRRPRSSTTFDRSLSASVDASQRPPRPPMTPPATVQHAPASLRPQLPVETP